MILVFVGISALLQRIDLHPVHALRSSIQPSRLLKPMVPWGNHVHFHTSPSHSDIIGFDWYHIHTTQTVLGSNFGTCCRTLCTINYLSGKQSHQWGCHFMNSPWTNDLLCGRFWCCAMHCFGSRNSLLIMEYTDKPAHTVNIVMFYRPYQLFSRNLFINTIWEGLEHNN